MKKPLVVSNVCKHFGYKQVLDSVSFSVEPASIYGLVGLNGIGKTTLMKIILGLASADSGNVEIFGKQSSCIAAKKSLGHIPEKFQPPQLLTGEEFLEISAGYYGKKYSKSKAKEIAEELDFNPDALPNLISSYSKGMGQKLGLISLFLFDVQLLILDEPMSGLDPIARAKLKLRLKNFTQQGGSIIFSSHILADVLEIAETFGILHNSHLLFNGKPADCIAQQGVESLEDAFINIVSAS